MSSTSIIALLMIVLLAFVILVVIILLDHRKNAEELSQLESGNTVEPSAISEEASITIHKSCKTGNMQLLGFFMSLHVFIFVVDSDKRSMLHHFAFNPNENSMAIVELLIERGLDVNAQDCDGNTPLHLAMSPFQREVAKYLVDSGADPEIKSWKGISPHKMVQQDIVNFLNHT